MKAVLDYLQKDDPEAYEAVSKAIGSGKETTTFEDISKVGLQEDEFNDSSHWKVHAKALVEAFIGDVDFCADVLKLCTLHTHSLRKRVLSRLVQEVRVRGDIDLSDHLIALFPETESEGGIRRRSAESSSFLAKHTSSALGFGGSLKAVDERKLSAAREAQIAAECPGFDGEDGEEDIDTGFVTTNIS